MELNDFWSWSGRYIGYRSSDGLFSAEGQQVGIFAEGDEVYGRFGEYIGEVRSSNRLITNVSKKKWTRASFTPRFLKSTPGHRDLIPRDDLVGFVDFAVSGNGTEERAVSNVV